MDKPDKQIQLSGIIVNSLDDNRTTEEMSRLAYQSRTHLMALDALRRLGVQTEGFGCPIEYERNID